MCIFSYKNNFVFFHIPKCGGTSIYDMLRDVLDKEIFVEHTHYTYLEAKSLFEKNGKKEWFENATKIAIVRNPFDRMVSLYSYIKQHKNHHLHYQIKQLNFNQFCHFVSILLEEENSNVLSCFDYLKNNDEKLEQSINIFKLEDLKNKEKFNQLSYLFKAENRVIYQLNCSFYIDENFKKSESYIKKIFKNDYQNFLY